MQMCASQFVRAKKEKHRRSFASFLQVFNKFNMAQAFAVSLLIFKSTRYYNLITNYVLFPKTGYGTGEAEAEGWGGVFDPCLNVPILFCFRKQDMER